MAIGSDPIIGENFAKPWGKLSEKEKTEWFAFMEEHWHPNLLNGYAKIIERVPSEKLLYSEQTFELKILGG